MEAAICIDAVEDALAYCGKPDMFNTDQASQFTSMEFTAELKKAEITISIWHACVAGERVGPRGLAFLARYNRIAMVSKIFACPSVSVGVLPFSVKISYDASIFSISNTTEPWLSPI